MQVTENIIPTGDIQLQTYTPKDDSLIRFAIVDRNYGLSNDYIEAHIYTPTNDLLASNYNFTSYYTSTNSQVSANNTVKELYLDPSQDLIKGGYTTGDLKISYNFLRKYFDSSLSSPFFIKEISTDRTELRLSSNVLSNDDLVNGFTSFSNEFNSLSYYKDFYLNFGENKLIIGINLALDVNTFPNTVLIKLYEPLPPEFDLRSTCWIAESIGDPVTFEVKFTPEEVNIVNPFLRGPNFNIDIVDKQNISTPYLDYDDLFTTPVSSSYQATLSILNEKGVEINADYTDFSNFIHFSSAKERLLNFYYKLSLIEGYSSGQLSTGNINNITGPTSASSAVSSSQALIQSNIENIIKKFDGFEYYLYYESNSFAFPKSSTTKPYSLYSVTSSQALSWLGSDNESNTYYGGQILSASLYDKNNLDNLTNTIPNYLKEDDQNASYELFLNMIGQHFDNVWIYERAISDLYNAHNSVYKGISKDLVAQALRSLGVQLYTNNTSAYDVFQYFLGVNSSGSFLYPTTPFETLVTASIGTTFYSTPADEINKEIYKRLYHNLPYLLKTKGTERGLRALISCYGIPDTILRINEFGGSDKESGSFEQYYNRFSYALNCGLGGYVKIPWAPSYYKALTTQGSNTSIVPDAIEFRFNSIPLSGSTLNHTQSLLQVGSGSVSQFAVTTRYNPNIATGSYLNYGYVDFILYNSSNTTQFKSCSVYLPIFDEGWWNVLVYRETGSLAQNQSSIVNTYKLIVKNSIYNGHDGNSVGFQASASLVNPGSTYNASWMNYNTGSLIGFIGGHPDGLNSFPSSQFSGSIQEYRNWIYNVPTTSSSTPSGIALNESVFNFHTMNPTSFEGNTISSSYTDLIFRLPLGNDLYLYNHGLDPLDFSTHPTINELYSGSLGAKPSTGSFLMNSSFNINSLYGISQYGSGIYGGTSGLGGTVTISFGIATGFPVGSSYSNHTEEYYLNSPNTGIGKRVNDKIRITSYSTVSGSISGSFLTTGSMLSPFTRIEEPPAVPLTQDLHILEVALSPQDEISDDIIAQLGYFNIDEYIGDPRLETSSIYPNLNTLRDFYFKKYISNYNLFDYIRLIKYFDNSLFKMIKDYVPARANLSTGIVIKPHILERNKIVRHTPEFTSILTTASIDIGTYSADDGGILYKTKNFILGGSF